MKISSVVFSIFVASLLISYATVHGETSVEYIIQIRENGSAAWVIRQTGANITDPLSMLSTLRDKVISLVDVAKNKTGRDMSVNEDTMSVNMLTANLDTLVEYRFVWENFGKIENNTRIVIGDVFEIDGFFLRLYGYGTAYNVTYPSQYSVEASPIPKPYMQSETLHTILWLGTTVFGTGQPRIMFNEKSSSSGFFDSLGQNILPIAGLATIISGFSVGLYAFKRHNRKEAKVAKIPELPTRWEMESDEEKTVRVLESAGGSLHQSAITDRCRFSKAKTSQLLTAMEGKGIVKRYKKGRDKIVMLTETEKK